MAAPNQQLMSVEEYLALPEEKPYLEYVNGRVCAKPVVNWRHAEITSALYDALRSWARPGGGKVLWEGRTGFDDPRDLRLLLPDLSYYAPGRPYRTTPMPPPTLAVEVRSPGQPVEQLREKCRFYRGHGVDACWLIDPEGRTAEVFEAGRDGVTLPADGALGAAALPAFSLPLAELFAVLDEGEDE